MLKQHFLLAFAAILLCFTACEEQTFDPVLMPGAPSTISAPADGSSFVIAEGTEDDELMTLMWSAADFGFPAGATYAVEADLAGNDFAEAVELASGLNALMATVRNGAVNNFLIGREIAGGTAADIQVRVKAKVGTTEDNNVLVSSPVTFNVTPFEAEREYEKLYVPGSYQGWDPSNETTVVYSVEDNGRYEGYLFFPEPDAEFKFTLENNWDNGDFGDNDTDGTLDAGGANIPVGAAGLYRINADINDLTYSATPTNWGLIGSATPTGWDSDTDLTYDEATGVLSITIDLVAGEFKFRANDEWNIDFGDTGADQKVEYGGDNIAVAEDGNYTIQLLLNQPIYEYTIVQN